MRVSSFGTLTLKQTPCFSPRHTQRRAADLDIKKKKTYKALRPCIFRLPFHHIHIISDSSQTIFVLNSSSDNSHHTHLSFRLKAVSRAHPLSRIPTSTNFKIPPKWPSRSSRSPSTTAALTAARQLTLAPTISAPAARTAPVAPIERCLSPRISQQATSLVQLQAMPDSTERAAPMHVYAHTHTSDACRHAVYNTCVQWRSSGDSWSMAAPSPQWLPELVLVPPSALTLACLKPHIINTSRQNATRSFQCLVSLRIGGPRSMGGTFLPF